MNCSGKYVPAHIREHSYEIWRDPDVVRLIVAELGPIQEKINLKNDFCTSSSTSNNQCATTNAEPVTEVLVAAEIGLRFGLHCAPYMLQKRHSAPAKSLNVQGLPHVSSGC